MVTAPYFFRGLYHLEAGQYIGTYCKESTDPGVINTLSHLCHKLTYGKICIVVQAVMNRLGGFSLKKRTKFAAILCFTGALSLSFGFLNHKDLSNAEAASQSKIIPNVGFIPFVSEANATIRVTAEEQNIVENSPYLFGFVQQQNGQGFFFEKVTK